MHIPMLFKRFLPRRIFPLLVYLKLLHFATSQDGSLDSEGGAGPCDFHALCLCDRGHGKAMCRAVPFTALPETRGYSHVTIQQCQSLRILRSTAHLRQSKVSSLHINDNPLRRIEHEAFSSTPNLTNLDLSRNRLTSFPAAAVLPLARLQRLDLRFNSIGEIDVQDMTTMARKLRSLRSLHISSNILTSIPDATFSALGNLTILDLDNNHILQIDGRPFPSSLVRLNLTGNLLEHVPAHALADLRNLSYLLLADNAIKRLDPNWTLPTSHLDTLHLGRNVISQLPPRFFANQKKVTVRHFILSDNYHRYVPPSLFKFLAPRHISFSVNHIESLPEELFQGLDDVVTNLDVAHNRLAEFPRAITKLRRLHMLNMRDNRLSQFGEYDLFSCRVSLRVLDISNNDFESVPRIAIKFLSRLKSLNIADNALKSIESHDFKHGLSELLSLDLSGNKIKYIEEHAFGTLSKLASLRLAYNPIAVLDTNWFPVGCTSLRALDISGTRLELDTVNSFLRACNGINSLDISYAMLPDLEPTILDGMSELIALNAMQNDWQAMPKSCHNSTIQSKLANIIVKRNKIRGIQPCTFNDLTRLQTIDLSANLVSRLESNTFHKLHNLTKLRLSHNEISVLHRAALHDVPQLRDIDLSFNKLSELNVQFIINHNMHQSLHINLSYNQISHLKLSNNVEDLILNVSSLDLSHNIIESISRQFFWTTRHSLNFLDLSHNKLATVSIEVTSELPRVMVLNLSHNRIAQLSPRSFQASSDIHVLHLSHNRLSALPEEAFARMTRLQVLNLDHNQITSLPDDSLEGTALVDLSLSHNLLARPFTKAFAAVKHTLAHLDLSYNKIRLIATSEFDHLFNMESLDLSSNRILVLPAQVFANLTRLVTLDVSRNPLLRVQPGSFDLPVSVLTLDECNLTSVPDMNAPNLSELSLSRNSIDNLSATSFAGLGKLRKLDLSLNHIREIDSGLWQHITDLRSLNISKNPIKELGSGNFKLLLRLHHLDITHLQLVFLDARTLDPLKFLRSIRTNTYSSARAFRLQEMLFQGKALQTLDVRVDEATLSYQIQWAFSKKIRELSVTGSELRLVAADAFEGLHPHGPFTLLVRNCPLLESLPLGLLHRWAELPRLSVDLSDNAALTSFVAGDEEEAEQTDAAQDNRISHYVTSSFVLRGTPWSCDCHLLWFQRRLRRQRRHLSWSMGTSDDLRPDLRCSVPGTSDTTISIYELRPGTAYCAGDATGRGSTTACFTVVHCIALVLAVLHVG